MTRFVPHRVPAHASPARRLARGGRDLVGDGRAPSRRGLTRLRRVFIVAVASAAVVGVAVGLLLHNEFGSSRALARPTLPALYGQATWRSGEVPAPPFQLRDQHGRIVRLTALRGRPVVLAFMDSLCTSECPIEAAQFAAALRPLSGSAKPRLVVVSVDLADTPASVARAARKWHLPGRVRMAARDARRARARLACVRHRRPTDEGRRRGAQRRLLRARSKRRRACRLHLAVHPGPPDARPSASRRRDLERVALAAADRDREPVPGRGERADPARVVAAGRVVGEVEVEHQPAAARCRGRSP